jgi:TonB family protein
MRASPFGVLGLALAACAPRPSAPPRAAGSVVAGPIAPPAPPAPCAGHVPAAPLFVALERRAPAAPESVVGAGPVDAAPPAAQPFFTAFKKSVGSRWRPEALMPAERLGAAHGYGDRYTETCLRVDGGGRLADATVRQSSGLGVLDDAVLEALRTAAPFERPPAGLAAPDGSLSFGAGFLYEIDPEAPTCAAPRAAPALSFGATPLVPLCERAYVDPAARPERVAALREARAKAERRLADLLGPLRAAAPLTIFCESDPCRVYFTGPTRRSCIIKPGETAPGGRFASGSQPTVVIDRTDERAVNELAHDLAHIELRARVGEVFIPQWFNDGVATLAADEPWCAGTEEPVLEDLRSLDDRDAWHEMQEHVSLRTRAAVYCDARRAVVAWMDAHGGQAALVGLLEAVAGGQAFYAAYEHPRPASARQRD